MAKFDFDSIKEVSVTLYEDCKGAQHKTLEEAQRANKLIKFAHYYDCHISLEDFRYDPTVKNLVELLTDHRAAILEFLGPTT